VVWKQYINSPVFALAKARGFATWGYVLNEPSHLGANLTRLAASPNIDLLGAPSEESTSLVTDVVAAAIHNGKQAMMSVVRTEADRSRARQLGCSGLMASRIKELLAEPAGG